MVYNMRRPISLSPLNRCTFLIRVTAAAGDHPSCHPARGHQSIAGNTPFIHTPRANLCSSCPKVHEKPLADKERMCYVGNKREIWMYNLVMDC